MRTIGTDDMRIGLKLTLYNLLQQKICYTPRKIILRKVNALLKCFVGIVTSILLMQNLAMRDRSASQIIFR